RPTSTRALPATRPKRTSSTSTMPRAREAMAGGASQPRHVGFEAEEVLADGLEVSLAALELLGHRMQIAQPALERTALEDRRRPRRVIGHLDDVARAMDRERRRQANADPLVEREMSGPPDGVPDLAERGHQQQSRGAERSLGLPHLRLDERILPQRVSEAARGLLPRHPH